MIVIRWLWVVSPLLLLVASSIEPQLKYACGICQEIRRGLPCERYGACDARNRADVEMHCSNACRRLNLAANSSSYNLKSLELRVTRALGSKGYNFLRLSVISASEVSPQVGFFDYSSQFQHRWRQFYLHTALKEVMPGVVNRFMVAGKSVSVWLPPQGKGVAGLLIADPCVVARTVIGLVGCTFGERHNTRKNTPLLINAFTNSTDTDFWSISGDNFYDRTGAITEEVYSSISLEAKSKIFAAVPGNHDYWVLGQPGLSSGEDQCGNGFMQWYGQDSLAARNVTAKSAQPPFDFSIDPGRRLLGCHKAAQSNFLWYNQVGNIGLVGQTGAYSLDSVRPFMQEACSWASSQSGLQVLVLFGHWDAPGSGATKKMAMPQWYTEMAAVTGCSEFDKRGMLKFVMGHTHCNDPHPHGKVGTGFRVAGFGMVGCGNYGMPIIDTTDGLVRVWYFDTSTTDLVDKVLGCVSQKGWRSCTSLAKLWLSQQIPNPGLQQPLVV